VMALGLAWDRCREVSVLRVRSRFGRLQCCCAPETSAEPLPSSPMPERALSPPPRSRLPAHWSRPAHAPLPPRRQQGEGFAMHHLIPQAPCLVTEGGEWAADYVVRMEHMQEDMREVGAGVGGCGGGSASCTRGGGGGC
jgi:hypothetical protein